MLFSLLYLIVRRVLGMGRLKGTETRDPCWDQGLLS